MEERFRTTSGVQQITQRTTQEGGQVNAARMRGPEVRGYHRQRGGLQFLLLFLLLLVLLLPLLLLLLPPPPPPQSLFYSPRLPLSSHVPYDARGPVKTDTDLPLTRTHILERFGPVRANRRVARVPADPLYRVQVSGKDGPMERLRTELIPVCQRQPALFHEVPDEDACAGRQRLASGMYPAACIHGKNNGEGT